MHKLARQLAQSFAQGQFTAFKGVCQLDWPGQADRLPATWSYLQPLADGKEK